MSIDKKSYIIGRRAGGGSGGGGSMRVGVVTNGDKFPTARPDGSALMNNDYVSVNASSTFPFDVEGVTFNGAGDTAYVLNGKWYLQASQVLSINDVRLVGNKTSEELKIFDRIIKVDELPTADIIEKVFYETPDNVLHWFEEKEWHEIKGEPDEYLKSVVKDDKKQTITLTDKNGNETVFPFGSGAEIDEYLKSISKDDELETITITDKNGIETTFPYGQKVWLGTDEPPTDDYEIWINPDGDEANYLATIKKGADSVVITDNMGNQTEIPFGGGVVQAQKVQLGTPTDIEKIKDFAYKMKFDETDDDYAVKYFEQRNDDEYVEKVKDGRNGIGGCSAIAKGNLFGRNLDWTYSNMADMLVQQPAKDGKYAYHGIAGSLAEMTEDFIKSGKYSDAYKIIPYYLQDGINSEGLACATLVVPTDYGFNEVKASEETRKRVCNLAFVKEVLENFATIDEAVKEITAHWDIFFPETLHRMGYETHYLLLDKTGNIKAIEFIKNKVVVLDVPYLTNFYRHGTTMNADGTVNTPENQDSGKPSVVNGITAHGSGLERHNIIAKYYEGLKDHADMRNLLTDLKYTRTYTPSPDHAIPRWNTELVGSLGTTVDSTPKDYDPAFEIADGYYNEKSRDTELTWQTCHSVIYNTEDCSMYVVFQEDGEELFYAFPFVKEESGGTNIHYVDTLPRKPEDGIYITHKSGEGEVQQIPIVDAGYNNYFKLAEFPEGMDCKVEYKDGYYDITLTEGETTMSLTVPAPLMLTELLELRPYGDVIVPCSEEEAEFYSDGDSRNYDNAGVILPMGVKFEDLPPIYWMNFVEPYASMIKVNLDDNALIANGEGISLNTYDGLANFFFMAFREGIIVNSDEGNACMKLTTMVKNDMLDNQRICVQVVGTQEYAEEYKVIDGQIIKTGEATSSMITSDNPRPAMASAVYQKINDTKHELLERIWEFDRAKQDVLIAGDGIVIENNVISASGGSGSYEFATIKGSPRDNMALGGELTALEELSDAAQKTADSAGQAAAAAQKTADGASLAASTAQKTADSKQNQLKVGTGITIKDDVISAVSTIIAEDITADFTVGGIKDGDLIPAGTTLTQFAKMLLRGRNYLCFRAEQANSTIKLNKNGSPADVSLVVSTDGNTWNDYAIGETITLENVGDKVYMRAKTENETISSDSSDYYRFAMTGLIGASGNIQYLLDSTGQRLDVPTYCYRAMFQGCAGLTKAPELPATTLANNCYSSMFSGCTSLISAPELPATTLVDYCYSSMFQGCTSLIETPELLATTLANSCCQYMFQNCTSLTQVPELPAMTLTTFCYTSMFQGCTGIKLSTTQTGEYQTPYRIPKEGTGTAGGTSLSNMFIDTGGTFKGTPTINTTYYGAW